MIASLDRLIWVGMLIVVLISLVIFMISLSENMNEKETALSRVFVSFSNVGLRKITFLGKLKARFIFIIIPFSAIMCVLNGYWFSFVCAIGTIALVSLSALNTIDAHKGCVKDINEKEKKRKTV